MTLSKAETGEGMSVSSNQLFRRVKIRLMSYVTSEELKLADDSLCCRWQSYE